MILVFIVAVVSFILSLLSVGLLKQRFSQLLLDVPNERSSHTQPTPRGGGLGFILAFALTSIVAELINTPMSTHILWWLVLIPLTIIGIIDDRFGLPALIRYLVQFLTAIIAIANWGYFSFPGLDSLGISGQIIEIVLTIIGITAMINFYNFMDGLDGLVAGCTLVQLGFLALYLNQPILWLLVSALAGFLYWNWSPAKIFMGDAGSTVLGATVALAILDSNQPSLQLWSALAISLPLVSDAIYTLFCRLIRRENIFQAHRSHLYQRLQQSGWSHGQVASCYIVINVLVATTIFLWQGIGAWLSLAIALLAIVSGELYLQFAPNLTFSTSKD